LTGDGATVRKWYFATNANGLRHAFDQIVVAVLSWRANCELDAYCLCDEEGGDAETTRRASWIKSQGVHVIDHRASMVGLLRPKFGDAMKIYSGHWLRCDISEIENDEDFVLYTDIDVMFVGGGPRAFPAPKCLACGPEHGMDDYSYFNSGVMVMNLPAWRARKRELIGVVEARLSVTRPYDDQSALNALFAGVWDRLPPTWNWKPYWGRNDEAKIVHFHGPKPGHARRMLAGERDLFGRDFQVIFDRDPGGYRYYLDAVDALTATSGLAPGTLP
jgi:hypothetical protein